MFLKNLISNIDESINRLTQTKSVVCDKKTKLLLKFRKRKNNKKCKFESLLHVTSLSSINSDTIKINKFEKAIILWMVLIPSKIKNKEDATTEKPGGHLLSISLWGDDKSSKLIVRLVNPFPIDSCFAATYWLMWSEPIVSLPI